jgi:hypothetical protein
VNDRSEIDEGWGDLLDDEPPPAPRPAASASVASSAVEALPPPPTFTPRVADRPRGDSVVESMQSLMKTDSGAVPEAIVEVDGSLEPRLDAASASGSMPKLWESLWAESEASDGVPQAREEDSFAALLPRPPIVITPEATAAEDSGVGLRLAASLEPEAPARIGPDTRRTSKPAIEQSVELRRPPRAAEEVAARPTDDASDDVPVRPAVAARVAEEAPMRVRAPARARDDLGLDRSLRREAGGTKPRTVWIGGAALLATAAIVGIAMRGGESPSPTAPEPSEPAPAAARAKVTPPPEAKAAADAHAAVMKDAPPVAEEAQPDPDEGKAAVQPGDPAAAPSEPAPVPSEPAPANAPSEPVPSEPAPAPSEPAPAPAGSADYETAKAEYDASGSQDALAAMVKAACAMDDGPSARSAFRKLKPTELRKDALSACTAAGIDPTLSLEGPTPEELVKRARRELEAGDPAAALETARDSNRMKRSRDAILVMTLAACAQSDAEEARRLRKHVAKDDRAEVDAACAAKGVDLAVPPS